jgi:hypothetical protein
MLSFIVQVLIFILLIVFTGILDSSNIFQTSVTENIMNVTTWFLFSTNPLFAAVVSEAILISDQSLFMTSSGMFGTMSFPLPSPWIIYTAFHAVMTALLIALSIRFVNRLIVSLHVISRIKNRQIKSPVTFVAGLFVSYIFSKISIAALILARHFSLPTISMLSNNGGLTFCPVVATRKIPKT